MKDLKGIQLDFNLAQKDNNKDEITFDWSLIFIVCSWFLGMTVNICKVVSVLFSRNLYKVSDIVISTVIQVYLNEYQTWTLSNIYLFHIILEVFYVFPYILIERCWKTGEQIHFHFINNHWLTIYGNLFVGTFYWIRENGECFISKAAVR